jgi:hypothetical protein
MITTMGLYRKWENGGSGNMTIMSPAVFLQNGWMEERKVQTKDVRLGEALPERFQFCYCVHGFESSTIYFYYYLPYTVQIFGNDYNKSKPDSGGN